MGDRYTRAPSCSHEPRTRGHSAMRWGRSILLAGIISLAVPPTARAAEGWPDPVEGFTRQGWTGNIKADWSDDYTFYYQLEALDLLLIHHGYRDCAPNNVEKTEDGIRDAQRAWGQVVDTYVLRAAFWTELVSRQPVRPGDFSPAVLALEWLMDVKEEATRGALFDQHSVDETDDCNSFFSDELANRLVAWWQSGFDSQYTKEHLIQAGVETEIWEELLRQREVRNVGGCEGRAVLVKAFGTGFIIVWLALALTFLAFYDDSGKMHAPVTQAVLLSGIPPWLGRAMVFIAYPCLAMLGMSVAHFFAMLGTRAWVYDWAQVISAGVLVIGGALIFLRIMAALGDVSMSRGKAACVVTSFVLLNLGFFLLSFSLYASLNLDDANAGDILLALFAILAFVAWALGIYKVTAYARLWRALMLVVSCIFVATVPPVLLFCAHLMVGIEVVMPCILVGVCFFIEHVLGGFATQRCEFTAETQWLLSYCFRYPVELVRFLTVAAQLLDCLIGDSEWWRLIVNLLLTFLIESKVVQLSMMCRSKPTLTAHATMTLEPKIPFTAGEIFLQIGVSPWSWRSMAVAPVLEFVVIGTHIVQVLACGIPAGVSVGGWIGGLCLIAGMSIVREVLVRIVSQYVGLRLPVTRVPWEMMRVHHLTLTVGAAATASSQAMFMHLSRMYVHHWHACIVRPSGHLATNDWEAGGPLIMAFVGVCSLLLMLLSWLGWRSFLKKVMESSLKSRPSREGTDMFLGEGDAAVDEKGNARSSKPRSNSSPTVPATAGWGDALGNLDEEEEGGILNMLTMPLKFLSAHSHSPPHSKRDSRGDEARALLPGAVDGEQAENEKDSTGVAPTKGAGYVAVVPGAGTGEQPDANAQSDAKGSDALRKAGDVKDHRARFDSKEDALENLSKAVAAKDRAEIEVALEVLQAMDVPSDHALIEEARSSIRHIQAAEEQRELAEQDLLLGGSVRDKARLARALTQARTLGVDDTTIEAAEGALKSIVEEEERQREIVERLQLLTVSANQSSVVELREAIDQADKMGISGEEVEEARGVLRGLENREKQQEVTRQLYDALANRDVESAMVAMSKTKRANLMAADELAVASQTLQRLISDIGDRQITDNVMAQYRTMKDRSTTPDPVEVEKIVDQFDMLGARGPVVDEAKRELEKVSNQRKRASALQVLDEAIGKGDMPAATVALSAVKELQVDESVYAESAGRLQALEIELKKKGALAALETAVHTRGREALEAAIALAVELGLEDHPLCESARGHVVSLKRAAERREAATRELIICMDTCERTEDLQAAIQNANHNNVDESKVAEAEACLRKLIEREEQRKNTTAKLQELVGSASTSAKKFGQSQLLRQVIEQAETHGVNRGDIDTAKQALQHLVAVEEQEALMNQIQEYLMVQDLDSAMAAIARAKRSPVANDAEILVVEEELDQLLKETEVETAKQDALQRVTSALQSTAINTSDLEKFIDQARMLGANEPIVDEAASKLQLLKDQKAKDEALEKLKQATAGTDIDACKTAYEAAKEAGVGAADLESAAQRIQYLEAEAEKQRQQAAARSALNTFLKNGTSSMESELVKAIEEARVAGLSAEDIDPAVQLLKEIQLQKLRSQAMWKVKEAIALRNPEAIRPAIDAAKATGVKEAEIEAAEAELRRAVEELRLEKIRAEAMAKLKALLETATTAHIKAVEEAVAAAQGVGVDEQELAHPQQALAALIKQDRQEKAIAAVTEALASQIPEKVAEAIAHAKEVEVDPARVTQMEKELRELREDLAVANDMQQLLQNRTERASAAVSTARDPKTPAKVVEEMFNNELHALKQAIAESRQAKLVKWKAIQGAEAVLSEVTAELRRIHEQKQKEEKQRAEVKLHSVLSSVKAKNPILEPDLERLYTEIKEAKVFKADTAETERIYEDLKREYHSKVAAAQSAIKAAIDALDGIALAAAVETCKFLQLTSVVTQASQSASAILESKISQVRHEPDKSIRVAEIAKMEVLLDLVRNLGDEKLRRKLHNDIQDLKGAVRVYCRIRPFIKREKDAGDSISSKMEDAFTVGVEHRQGHDWFQYDAIFGPESTQEEVYEECRQLVQSSVDGYNVTIFTYGQTGAGKTWTLYGSAEQPGISPRTCEEIFKVMNREQDRFDFVVKASMVELYCSHLRDLLSNEKEPPPIEIHPEKGRNGQPMIRLQGVSDREVKNLQDLTQVIGTGLKQRKVKATNMNATSSRSHLLLMISVDSTSKATGQERHGKVTIVDLAGCERLSKSGVQGQEMKEAIEINKSLTALGDVMMAITSGTKVVPYRNHKLTQLMQDSLGGSAKTLMFVNISPASSNSDETVNALKYASRARCIENDNNYR